MTLAEYNNGLDVIGQVLSGHARYGVFHSALVRARLEGKPVKLLANYFKRLPLVILTSPEIKTLADLRGKKLMIAKKDLDSPLTRVAFEQEGLDVGKNISIVPHTYDAAPFIKGEVDAMSAFITNEPFFLEQQGVDFNIIELSDYMRSMGELYLFTSDAQADNHPNLTRHLIEATNEGWQYALAHKEEIVDLILKDYSKRKTRDALLYEAQMTHKMVMPLPVPVGSIFDSLIEEIAILIMKQNNIQDKTPLQNFIFRPGPPRGKVVLSLQEKAYLEDTLFQRRLSFGWQPFNLKEKDGDIIGLSEDYWALIRDKLGLKESTAGEPVLFPRILQLMQQGHTDIYPSTSRTTDREMYAVFSNSYESFPIAIATRPNTEFIFNTASLEGQVVTVGRNYSAYHLMKARYPKIRLTQVKNTKEALESVMKGEAYAAVDILPVLQYQLNRLPIEKIRLGGVTDVQFPVQIMVHKEHTRLVPLINRAISAISPEERSMIHQKWMVQSIIEKTDYTRLWQILIITAIILLGFLFWNRRMAVEIVRRKRIEAQLKRLSEAVEQSPSPIFITDANATIEYVNPSFTQLTGYSSRQAVGKTPAILKSGIHDDYFYSAMWDSLIHKGLWKGELCNKKRDGSLFWEMATISSIKDDNENITHYVAVKEDITRHKKDQKEKKMMAARLQQAQKLETIGLMAGGVAHDLNNILSGIVGYPELLLEDLPQDSPFRNPIETIQESGKRATQVVADLLTVARGAASTREFNDLNILINEYLASPEYIKLKSNYPLLSWHHELSAEQSIISCSPVHVKKCLMNLVNNGAEAVGGKGSVSVSTWNQDIDERDALKLNIQAGSYIGVQVKDSGPGIAQSDIEHIFEPFYTKKIMGRSGTGLGLTVVWNTMKDHNGMVTVESEHNGTLFTLYFPLSDEVEPVKFQEKKVNLISRRQEHILVVDDEKHLRDLACQMLSQLDYRVDAVPSGEAAIAFVQNKTVDLLVLDMIMEPGINGCRTYETILQQNPAQKAIIVSGFSESEDVKRALELGAGKYIKKPYSKDQIGRAVKEVLNE